MAAVARSEYADCEGIPYLLTFCFLNNITAYSIKEPIIKNLEIIISIHIRTEDKYFCPGSVKGASINMVDLILIPLPNLSEVFLTANSAFLLKIFFLRC